MSTSEILPRPATVDHRSEQGGMRHRAIAWADDGRAVASFAELESLMLQLVERLAPAPTDRVLALGEGARAFAHAAARREVPVLVPHGRAAGPISDGAFDLVLSLFAWTSAAETQRVARGTCRVGGRIAIVDWARTGFAAEIVRVVEHYLPPPPGAPAPFLSQDGSAPDALQRGAILIRAVSAEHWLAGMRSSGAPLHTSFESLGERLRFALERDLLELVARFARDRGEAGIEIPVVWRECVVRRR